MKRSREPLLFSRYRRRHFSNPFYPKQIRGRPWKKIFGVILLALILGLAFIFSSPFFVIQSIKINGATSLDVQTIKQSIESVLGRRSYLFLIREDNLKSRLTSEYPIESIQIQRLYPSTLEINITEREPFISWQSGETTVALDRWGIVLPQTEAASQLKLVFMDESAKSRLEVGAALFTGEIVQQIATLLLRIERELGILIVRVVFPTPESAYVKLETNEGWHIYFAIEASKINQQFEKLTAVLRDSVSDRSKLDYVDLRFSDRVFFK